MSESLEVRNKRVLFKAFLKGWPTEDDFIHEEKTIKLEVEPGSKDVLLKTIYLSVDPYMRGRMKGDFHSYVPPFTPGDVSEHYQLGTLQADRVRSSWSGCQHSAG